MANQVYANGREVACKAADGKSTAAFPDVCFLPPDKTPATPLGVPTPLPNTAFASDTAEGSKNVRISGKEVMLRDKSYLKKSTGNEASKPTQKKGLVTSTEDGKAYFNSWSMDVKFEGENVVRHLDLTTHNHASVPGNTMTWPYCDKQAMSPGAACHEQQKAERDACAEVEKRVESKNIPKNSRNKAMREAYCDDKECREARECMLMPYNPELSEGQAGCCDGKTPHHVVPVHCFMPPGVREAGGSERYVGCAGYDPDKAPCICVEGAGKEKKHGDIHEVFDALEDEHLDEHLVDGKAGSWSYLEASIAGAESVCAAVGCDPVCTKAQLDAYHQEQGRPKLKDDTPLRADSNGNRTPEGFKPKSPGKSRVGSNN